VVQDEETKDFAGQLWFPEQAFSWSDQKFSLKKSATMPLIYECHVGMAQEKEGVLQIHQNLMNNGINPLEVTKVLLSHLHKDHSGGISSEDKFQKGQLFNFPNALYYVNDAELKDALQNETSSNSLINLQLMTHSDQVITTREKGVIDDFISYEVVGGHSPNHQVFWIEEAGQKIFFGGDVAPQLQQMKSRLVAKYDFDGKKCMELRQQWWQQGEAENWTFLFYHDIKTPIYSR
jgi:glyoxylase-like metal-dependent hydrolase (beta-lactamase superfamily II)